MDKARQRLAGELLDLAAEKFSNHGCNDWKWPDYFTAHDRKRLAEEMVADNYSTTVGKLTKEQMEESREYLRPGGFGPPDWWVMRFLAQQLSG